MRDDIASIIILLDASRCYIKTLRGINRQLRASSYRQLMCMCNDYHNIYGTNENNPYSELCLIQIGIDTPQKK